ncbi:hypothetical protein glysoja_002110 [Glycine soja]|nr:hypothetical protein glysoja_002110 [Glycine soja]
MFVVSSTWGGSRQLTGQNNGFLEKDTCILQAEFTILGLMTPRIDI